MDALLDNLLWRLSLESAPCLPPLHDQLDWAALLQAAGEVDLAQMLFQTAFLRQGFSWQAREQHEQRAGQCGWWHGQPQGRSERLEGSTSDIALLELRALATTAARYYSAAVAPLGSTGSAPGAPKTGEASAGVLIGDLPGVIEKLYRFLEEQFPVAPGNVVSGAISWIVDARPRLRKLDYRSFSKASPSLLGTAIAFASLMEFDRLSDDFINGPLGSWELLHQAAQCDTAGLGPYMCNVGNVVRKSSDIFDLAQFARQVTDEVSGTSTDIEPWLILLSRNITGALLYEFIDDLGDLGEMALLSQIFARITRAIDSEINMDLIFRIRDTALDNHDYMLAAQAQNVVVRLKPDQGLERLILGSIQASGGDFASAERTFLDMSRGMPDDGDVIARLHAVRRRNFSGFEVKQGFGSPSARQHSRVNRVTMWERKARQSNHHVGVELY